MAPRHPLFAFLQGPPVPRAGSDRHLRPDEAEVLLAYLPARGQERLAHWAGCAACQEALRRHFAARAAAPAAMPTKRERIEAFEMVTAAVQDAGRRLDEEFEQADAHATALLATPAARRRGRIRAEARFRTLGVACRLIHRGLFAESPKAAESIARLAIAVVAALDPGDVMSLAAGEAKAKAWALIANARWQRRDVAATLRALDEAERALVEDGALRDRRAFRRAMRLLRLVERHLGNAVVSAGHALGQLLGSLWSQLPEDALRTGDSSTRPAAAPGEELENCMREPDRARCHPWAEVRQNVAAGARGSFPIEKLSFPLGWGSFPLGKRSFPFQKRGLPLQQRSFPLEKLSLALGRGSFPTGRGAFSTAPFVSPAPAASSARRFPPVVWIEGEPHA